MLTFLLTCSFVYWHVFGDLTETVVEIFIDIPLAFSTDVCLTVAIGMIIDISMGNYASNKDENFHSIENGFGKFTRSFQLPDDIDESTDVVLESSPV